MVGQRSGSPGCVFGDPVQHISIKTTHDDQDALRRYQAAPSCSLLIDIKTPDAIQCMQSPLAPRLPQAGAD